MTSLYLVEQGAKILKSSERLIIEKDKKKLLEEPIIKIQNVNIYGNIQISTQALSLLFEKGVQTSFFTLRGILKGKLTPLKPKNNILRIKQYEKSKDPNFSTKISKKIARQKIKNLIKIIEGFRSNHPNKFLADTQKKINEFLSSIERKTKPKTILGIEGISSAYYYKAFSQMFLNELKFSGRNRRPPKDPVNSLLSFGYILVTNEIVHLLDAAGLDPYIGFLHSIDYGRPSLALDVLEEFRQPAVDRFVLYISNKRILCNSDFEKRDDGGVYLKKKSLKKFFIEYDKWMQKKWKTGFSLRDYLKKQVYKLTSSIKTDVDYSPLVLV